MLATHLLTFETVSPEARHFGIDPGFINEHDIADLARMSQKPAQTFAPNRPCRLHIGALLFTGVCGFFGADIA